jgi:hypothetical protein
MINIAESDRGKLTGIDLTSIPFVPKRIFIVNNVPVDEIRGDHAHYLDHQILYCLSGSLIVDKIYKSKDKDTIILNAGDTCDIPPLTWSTIKFAENNSSFLCVCSEQYDEKEYIRNYEKFIRIITNVNI